MNLNQKEEGILMNTLSLARHPDAVPRTSTRRSRAGRDQPCLACRHCHQRQGSESRGLCHRCYADRAIRAAYPVLQRLCRPQPCPPGEQRPLCQHCGLRVATYNRGICDACYREPGIREQYPPPGRLNTKPLPKPLPMPTREPEPTDALPGTEAKVEVLTQRLWSGEALFHPADMKARGE